MRSWCLAVVVASVTACSGPAGGSGDDVDAAVGGDQFSVVSSDGFLAVPPPACTEGQFIAELDAYQPACIGHQCVLVHHP